MGKCDILSVARKLVIATMDSALVGLAEKINSVLPMLDEKQRRIYLASEAIALGRGGVKAIHEISGASQTTIIRGKKEIGNGDAEGNNRIRSKGGGRKKTVEKYESIEKDLQKIVDEETKRMGIRRIHSHGQRRVSEI